MEFFPALHVNVYLLHFISPFQTLNTCIYWLCLAVKVMDSCHSDASFMLMFFVASFRHDRTLTPGSRTIFGTWCGSGITVEALINDRCVKLGLHLGWTLGSIPICSHAVCKAFCWIFIYLSMQLARMKG